MTQSTVASALSTAFGNIGIKDRVSCTKVLKVTVTAVYSKHPEQKHNVAVHMNHRTDTAEKYYCFVEKHTNRIRCTELLQQSMVTPATSGSVTHHRPDVTDATSSVSQNEE